MKHIKRVILYLVTKLICRGQWAAMEVLAAPLEQSEIDELVPQLLEGLDGIMRRQCDKETLSTSYRRDSFNPLPLPF